MKIMWHRPAEMHIMRRTVISLHGASLGPVSSVQRL